MPQPPRPESDGGLVEVADRVWVLRPASGDGNVTVVAGDRGPVVVDALGSVAAGRTLLTAVRRLGRGDPVGVVLTHGHERHVRGLAGLLEGLPSDVPVVVHEAAESVALEAAADAPARSGSVRTLSSVTALDLGDRVVEVVHPGRGHTDGDVVVRVPDAGVVVVGDLVAGGGPSTGRSDLSPGPTYGPDCWPLTWPGSLDLVLQLLDGSGAEALVVPGHGSLLDRTAVEEQRDAIATVAEAVRELAGRGVPEDRAPGQGEAEGAWPWPAERLVEAVRRGYAQLPRSARRLPLA